MSSSTTPAPPRYRASEPAPLASSAPSPPRQPAPQSSSRPASEPAPLASSAALVKDVQKLAAQETAAAGADDASALHLAPVFKEEGLTHPARPGLATVGRNLMVRAKHFLLGRTISPTNPTTKAPRAGQETVVQAAGPALGLQTTVSTPKALRAGQDVDTTVQVAGPALAAHDLINASDDRSASLIETKILDAVQMNSIMSDSKPKCLSVLALRQDRPAIRKTSFLSDITMTGFMPAWRNLSGFSGNYDADDDDLKSNI